MTPNDKLRLRKERMITPALLREAFAYDAATGIISWAHPKARNVVIGAEAGRVLGPYRQIKIADMEFKGHRVAWAIHYGEWPPLNSMLDHIDGDGLNNRISNLRLATRSENCWHSRRNRNHKIGLKGVFFHAGRYESTIMAHGRRYWLGRFDTPEAAHDAYAQKARELHGDFVRTS